MLSLKQTPRHSVCTLVVLQVCVRMGNELLTDEVEWDLSQLSMTPLRYASDLCHDMGLGFSWTQAVTRHVGARLDELHQAGVVSRVSGST